MLSCLTLKFRRINVQRVIYSESSNCSQWLSARVAAFTWLTGRCSGCVSVMDELGVGTEGDRRCRPLTADLLTVGEERRREIRSHYYSGTGK